MAPDAGDGPVTASGRVSKSGAHASASSTVSVASHGPEVVLSSAVAMQAALDGAAAALAKRVADALLRASKHGREGLGVQASTCVCDLCRHGGQWANWARIWGRQAGMEVTGLINVYAGLCEASVQSACCKRAVGWLHDCQSERVSKYDCQGEHAARLSQLCVPKE